MDTKPARLEFDRRMDARRASELNVEWKPVRRGWYLGSKKFREELVESMSRMSRDSHGGEGRRESEEAWAEKILREELKRRRWTEKDLKQRPKGDSQKLKVAQRLRKESTMTLTWLAQRLSMGAAGSLANLLRGARQR
ncbi:MAG TPA: hypothetical protein VN761_08555 [Candidatus Polarisedimenticolia bacterium]|nr:hypothetical protein [Candidatus Polarisedimenticolia bacterium]